MLVKPVTVSKSAIAGFYIIDRIFHNVNTGYYTSHRIFNLLSLNFPVITFFPWNYPEWKFSGIPQQAGAKNVFRKKENHSGFYKIEKKRFPL